VVEVTGTSEDEAPPTGVLALIGSFDGPAERHDDYVRERMPPTRRRPGVVATVPTPTHLSWSLFR